MSAPSAKKQERLITPVGFVLLVLVVIVMLVLLYPSQQSLFSGGKSPSDLKALFKDPVKLMYEQILHRQVVSSREVLDTVEYLSQKGHWKESRHLLEMKLGDSLPENERREAALWMLQSHLDEYYVLQNQGEKIDRPLGSAREQLQRFEQIDRLSAKELKLLAQSSLEFGLIPQAIETYFRLADIDKEKRLHWLDQAGSKAMQIQYYVDAANAYQLATADSQNDAEYKTYLYAWLNAATKTGDKVMVQDIIEGIKRDLPDDSVELEKLAAISLDIGRPSIAHRIYARLATVDKSNAERWYEKAGVWALSNKEYEQAANYFLSAENLTKKASEKERLRFQQYEAFNAGEMPKQALNTFKPLIAKHTDDQKLLKKGIDVALAAKDPKSARQWNLQYLEKNPNDFKALQRQADIEIRDENLDKAKIYLQKILEIKPKHISTHKKLAYMLENLGDDVGALRSWQALNNIDAKPEYIEQILRLAHVTLKQGSGLPILLVHGKKHQLKDQVVQDIVTYYIDRKQEDKAEVFLTEHLERHPTNNAQWKRLLSLREKRPDAVLATWRRIEKHFGVTDKSTLAQMSVLWEKQRKKEVLALFDARPQTLISETYYHQMLAELGWENDRFDLALRHYKTLLKTAKTVDQLSYYQRIAGIYSKQNDWGNVMKTYDDAWQATEDSDLLLYALQLAYEKRLSKDLNHFLKIAMQHEALFEQSVGYWQLRAQLASKASQYEKAEQYHRKVLAIEPASITARQGIIWLLTQTKQKKALYSTLKEWRTFAAKEEALWSAYALGLQSLGQVRASLPWYKHYIDENRQDFAMLLSYADQLDRFGRRDSAYRIRRYAAHNLRRFLRKNKITEEQRKEALFQYLGVVQRYGTIEAFDQLYQQLQGDYTNGKDQARLNEIALAWMLSSKQDEKARLLLMKAHEKRLKLPLWQLLAVAIKNKDKKAIDKLLENAADLPIETKVSALLAAGKQQKAFRLALRGIDEKRLSSERKQARELALSAADDNVSSLDFEYDNKRLGNLEVNSVGMTYSKGMQDDFPFAYDLDVRRNRLDYDDFAETELEVAVTGKWKDDDQRIEATVGVNHREDGNLYYAKARYQHQITDNFNASIEIGKNEVATEGAILRQVAKRDRIRASANANFDQQNTVQVTAWKHQFSTRDGEELADGQGMSAALIHKENMGSSQWHVGVQGQIESNNVEENLPEEVRERMGSTGTLISENPKSAGIVAGISRGSPGNGVPKVGSPRYSANAWVGKSWPTGETGMNLEASVGTRVLGNDELSATAFKNTVVGSDGAGDQGISVQYRKWFDTEADSERYRIEQ